jgi:hypothetical protein
MRLEETVQLIEHNSGAHPNGALFQIQSRDLPIVARELHDQAITDRAANQSRARAAGNDGDAGICRGPNR